MAGKKPELIVVCGAGRLGASLASRFSERGYNITIIDKKADSFRKLADSFSGYSVIGDATDIEVLQQNKADRAAIVFATTNNDNTNSFIGQIAGRIFGVPSVYVRINDEDKVELLSKYENITAISPTALFMAEFEEMSGIKL